MQIYGDEVHEVLCTALEEISMEIQYQEKCLSMLAHAIESPKEDSLVGKRDSEVHLFAKFQLMVSSVLMASLPPHFPGMFISNC